MLTVTTPATDLQLLTTAELRTAAGLAATDNGKDATLIAMGLRIASTMAKACKVAASGVSPVTLREETLTETFRLKSRQDKLLLSRKPIVSVTSITEVDVALAESAFETETSAGMLTRLYDDHSACWPCGKIVVVYVAGWATVPDDLKLAATKFVQALTQQGDRDPMLKSKSIEGVASYEWWVDPTKDCIVPAEVMDLLQSGGYVNTWIG
jgi:hypothetical protein